MWGKRLGIVLMFLGLTGVLSAQDTETTQWDGVFRRVWVPILMYHYISPLPADADNTRIGLTVEPDLFQAHLDYLKAQHYNTISLRELYQALMIGSPLPPNPIILTFDDGYIDHYVTVFPKLMAAGFKGTFFIITETADLNNAGYMSWPQIQEMAGNGMEMEPHTRRHMDLRNRDNEFLVYEIQGSIETMAHFLQRQPLSFAYPVGRYDLPVLRFMRSTSIKMAVTTRSGAYHNSSKTLELARLRVSGNMGLAGLEHLIQSSK